MRLGWQLLGLIVIMGWSMSHMFALFFVMWKLDFLRVDDAAIAGAGGLDMAEHGE